MTLNPEPLSHPQSLSQDQGPTQALPVQALSVQVLSVQVQPVQVQPELTWPHAAALRSTGIVLTGSILAAVCAHVSVPLFFTPVPLSLAPFAVLLLGLLLSPRLAAATFVTYLAEGAVGLPVFAPSPLSGLAHLFGPTGGYLLAYPVSAFLISILYRRTQRGFTAAALTTAAGSFVILACGALWLAALTHASLQSVFTLAVLPFLPGDALKIAAAAALGTGLIRLRRRMS
jgi:biotin transport system substrate-specific component